MATDKQKVLELAADRQHAQLPVEANGLGQAEEPHCGDLLRIGLVVNPRQVVVDAGFTITESACPPAVASAVIAVQLALNKPVLAAYLCQGRHYSQQVDRIVHPRVAQAFGQFCAAQPSATNANLPIPPGKCLSLEALQQLPASGVVFMECALLFESGFNRLVDYSVLVHVSAQTQLLRLMARDHISAQKAQNWIDLQLSESEKMARADAYIVNE